MMCSLHRAAGLFSVLALLAGCTDSEKVRFGVADDSAPVEQEETDGEAWGSVDQPWLLTFVGCPQDTCENAPIDVHQVWLLQSEDGERWRPPEGYETFAGSVPDLVRRDNTLYIFAVRMQVRRFHHDTDTWEEPVAMTLLDEQGNSIPLSDPSPILGEDGLLHMMYMESSLDGDPADCEEPTCTMNFVSAIEVEGSDGTLFQQQPGLRAQVTVTQGERCADPSLFRREDGGYAMEVLRQDDTVLLLSDQLHGTYTPAQGLREGGVFAPLYYGLMDSQWDPVSERYLSAASVAHIIENGDPPLVATELHTAWHPDLEQEVGGWQQAVRPDNPPGFPEDFWALSPGLARNTPGLD